jgi:hypothetical protein
MVDGEKFWKFYARRAACTASAGLDNEQLFSHRLPGIQVHCIPWPNQPHSAQEASLYVVEAAVCHTDRPVVVRFRVDFETRHARYVGCWFQTLHDVCRVSELQSPGINGFRELSSKVPQVSPGVRCRLPPTFGFDPKGLGFESRQNRRCVQTPRKKSWPHTSMLRPIDPL